MCPCMIVWVPVQYYMGMENGVKRNLFRGEQLYNYDELDNSNNGNDIFYDIDNEYVSDTLKQQ